MQLAFLCLLAYDRPMSTPFDAVLFDLDDTLCSYRRSSAELLQFAFDALDVDPLFPVDAYYERFGTFLGEYEDMGEFREACFVDAALAYDADTALAKEAAAVFERERDQTAVDPLPGAIEAIEALAETYHLGLVTNGPPHTQRTKLDAIGLADAFDVTVFAGFDTAAKPAVEPFDLALSELGVPADRAVHIGNSERSDVAGANAAGLASVWLAENGADGRGEATYVVESMTELQSPPWSSL